MILTAANDNTTMKPLWVVLNMTLNQTARRMKTKGKA